MTIPVKRYAALMLCLAAVVIGLTPVPASASSAQVRVLRSSINSYRQATQYWRNVALQPQRHWAYAEKRPHSVKFLQWLQSYMRGQMIAARRLAQNPPHLRDWLCIHRYEGSWTDPNPPYYGGLQMDMGFMQAYGGALLRKKGTADHWSPLEQIWVAERAYQSGRGFYPWPNTARLCGLI